MGQLSNLGARALQIGQSVKSVVEPITLRLLRWFIFSVAIAILPLVFNALAMATRGSPATLVAVCKHGELLIVSVAIAAAAAGDVLVSTPQWRIPKVISGGGCIILALLASLWFADISSAATSAGTTLDAQLISNGSRMIFLSTLFLGGFCIVLKEV